jgi:hypothetical protein
MEKSYTYKWVVILFFGIVGTMFTASVIYLATGNIAPDTYWGRSWRLPKTEGTTALLSADKVVLERDQYVAIGNRIFIFKGLQDDRIDLNVIIPELDRQYPYPFQVSLAEGNRGFEIAGIRLRLLAARRNFISVKFDQPAL